MSDIVEKALLSFRQLIDSGGSASITKSGLKNLLDATAGLSSKRDEKMIVTKELTLLQKELALPGLQSAQTRECLIRAIYCEMLGYPAPFAHIHAIKHAQLGSVVEKRIGYLAATLMLHDAHQLVILIVNTIQKDLKSANVLNICMALTACTHLIGSEMASAVVDLVEDNLSHPKALVRRRAVLTVHHFLLMCPSSVRHLVPKISALIGDRDPGVVAAALYPLQSIAKVDPESCIDLVGPLIDIQRQIIRRKLPSSFEYRGVPAPWMQLRILQILSVVGQSKDADSVRPLIREVLGETLKRTDVNQNCAHAIVCQCIGTLSSVIGANRPTENETDELVESGFACVGRFLGSSNPNIKYVGIKALAQMVKCLSSEHVAKRQAVVMECLRSPDSSIRRQTLDVLFELTNASNVDIVCSEMMKHVGDFEDDVSKGDILKRIFVLIDRWRPTNNWFLQMSNDILLKAGNEIPLPEVIDKVKDVLLSYGPSEDDLMTEAVTTYLNYLERRHELQLSPQMLLLACWTLGHRPLPSRANMYDVLAAVARECVTGNQDEVAIGALTALEYVVVHGECQVNITELGFEPCLESTVFAVQDRARELKHIIENIESVRPLFALSKEETSYDWTLSFMDQFVVNSLLAGGSPYKAPSLRTDITGTFREIRPTSGYLSDGMKDGPVERPSSSSLTAASDSLSSRDSSSQESHKVAKKLWSKDGFLDFSTLQNSSTATYTDSHEPTAKSELLAKALFGEPLNTLSQDGTGFVNS